MVPGDPVATMGLLWRGDRGPAAPPTRGDTLLGPVFEALGGLGVSARPVVYSDDAIDDVRQELSSLDGVLVWVNPIQDGADRTHLDALLREAADDGVWVSAHPDTILRMGTKEVLVRTNGLGWGTDARLYASPADFRSEFPLRLSADRVRVLKQLRGNGGQGVWKVELVAHSVVRVQQAVRDSSVEEMPLPDFIDSCVRYFERSGRIIDQPFQARLEEGMVRCYLVRDEVAGFCHQWPRGLLPPLAEDGVPRSRPTMEPATAPAYQGLRAKMEQEWVPQMITLLDLDNESMPVIWDADFLYGPKTGNGEDTFVLCEINVSAVWPYPESATPALARAAATAAIAANAARAR